MSFYDKMGCDLLSVVGSVGIPLQKMREIMTLTYQG